MDLHNPSVRGQMLLQNDPVDDLHAVPKRYVDLRTAGGVFITDILPTSTGLVGLKDYFENTAPAEYYLSEATTNVAAITVHFIAEPLGTGTMVQVTINGVPSTNITADPNNPRLFTGSVDLVVDEEKIEEVITAISSTGSEYSVDLDILIGGPPVQSLTLGDYPAGQTEVKQGDTVTASGTVRNDAQSIRLLNFGVSGQQKDFTLGDEDSGGAGFKTFTTSFTVSNRSGSQNIRAVATNLLGTDGDTFTSVDNMDMNQTYPSFGTYSSAYPAGQSAIKGSESMTFGYPISNADEFLYTASAGLTVDNPTSFETNKTVTRANETIQYSVGTNNVTIRAEKSSNGAVTTRSVAISVANSAPTAELLIVGDPNALRSSAGGENYTVEVRADQNLLEAPSNLVVPADAGTLSGTWSKVSDSRWRTVLTVDDGDTKGVHTFTSLEITGKAGVVGTTITDGEDYTIAGIVQRDLVVPALSQLVAIGTDVSDVSNLIVSYKGADVLTYFASKDQNPKGFTITDSEGNVDTNGDYVYLTDADFAGSNTSGTLVLEFEETV